MESLRPLPGKFGRSIQVVVWVNVPEPDAAVAVIVRVYVPTGVPRREGLVPPPHEVRSPVASIVTKRTAVVGLKCESSSPRRR